jgi:prevent-host-death family protein
MNGVLARFIASTCGRKVSTGCSAERSSLTMRTATVADLRNRFSQVAKWIGEGEAVTITKRGVPFATLAPARKRKVPLPVNWQARLERVFPEGPVKGDSQRTIDVDRGET